MSDSILQDMPTRVDPVERFALIGFWLLFGLWGACAVATGVSFWMPFLEEQRWIHGAFLVLTCTTAIVNAGRSLPIQNVLAVACLVGGIGGVLHGINVVASFPFGSCVYTLDIGRLLFDFLPWPMPFVWILFIISSRGTARLILVPWREHRNYGFILLGLTTTLVLVLDAGLEVFASDVFNYWLWVPKTIMPAWYVVPFSNFVGWGSVTLLILVMATPFLISKSPRPPRPDAIPVVVWSVTSLLFAFAFFASELIHAGVIQTALTLPVPGLVVWQALRRRPR